jgi:hypothetical protein
MTKLQMIVMGWALTLASTAALFGQERSASEPASAPEIRLNYGHPVVPGEAAWPGYLLLGVAWMFFAAAFLGPFVRTHTPEEVPPAHSHDEPPGASGHHGPGGTVVVPEPEDTLGHHH